VRRLPFRIKNAAATPRFFMPPAGFRAWSIMIMIGVDPGAMACFDHDASAATAPVAAAVRARRNTK
jgi:hypothetical protein